MQVNDFYLIEYSSGYGQASGCESVDYNLSSGKLIFTKEVDEYDDNEEPTGEILKFEDIIIRKMKLPRIDNIVFGELKVSSEKTGITTYLF